MAAAPSFRCRPDQGESRSMGVKFLDRLKVRHKLALGFSVVLLFLAAIVVSNSIMVGSMGREARFVQDHSLKRTIILHELDTNVQARILRFDADRYTETRDNESERKRLDGLILEKVAAAKTLLQGDREDSEGLERIVSLYGEWDRTAEQLLTETIYGDVVAAEGTSKRYDRLTSDLKGEISRLAGRGMEELAAAMDHIERKGIDIRRTGRMLGLAALVFSIGILYALNRVLMVPITNLSGLMSSTERGDFTVLFDNDSLIRCHDALQCGKEGCSAWDAENLRCWQISGTHCRGEIQGDMANKLGSCEECTVYRHAMGDEFSIIGESFNNMLAGLSGAYSEFRAASARVLQFSKNLQVLSRDVKNGNISQVMALEEAGRSIEEMDGSMKGISGMVESYLMSAESSSSAIAEMSASIAQVAASAETLSTVGDRTTAAIEELFGSVKSASTGVDSLSDDVSDISGAITEMSASVKESEEAALNVAALSEEVSKNVLKGSRDAVARAIGGMDKISAAVEEANGIISDLGAKSQDIGSILEVIRDVSEQTNLLALNAAIIAAGAGEHGRGFSVVAEEVRQLSERTGSSTQEIRSLVETIQGGLETAVQSIQKGSESVESGVELVTKVDDSLRRVEEAAEKSLDSSKFIVRITSEQAQTANQITQASLNISRKAKTIAGSARDQASTCDGLAKNVEEIGAMMEEVKRTTEEQSRTARQISDTALKSTEAVENIERATKDEARQSAALVDAIGSVREVAESFGSVVSSLEGMVASLEGQASSLDAQLGGMKVKDVLPAPPVEPADPEEAASRPSPGT